jgi:hypothetical protein
MVSEKCLFKFVEMSSIVVGPRRYRSHFGEKNKHGSYKALRTATLKSSLASASDASYVIVASADPVSERSRPSKSNPTIASRSLYSPHAPARAFGSATMVTRGHPPGTGT